MAFQGGEKKFGGYVTVLYLDCCCGYKTQYICQNPELYIKDEFLLYVNHTSMNLIYKKTTLLIYWFWFIRKFSLSL